MSDIDQIDLDEEDFPFAECIDDGAGDPAITEDALDDIGQELLFAQAGLIASVLRRPQVLEVLRDQLGLDRPREVVHVTDLTRIRSTAQLVRSRASRAWMVIGAVLGLVFGFALLHLLSPGVVHIAGATNTQFVLTSGISEWPYQIIILVVTGAIGAAVAGLLGPKAELVTTLYVLDGNGKEYPVVSDLNLDCHAGDTQPVLQKTRQQEV